MDSKKAERLEKHKKEIKRKAYLNLFLTLVAGLGIGLFLWGPVAGFLNLFIGQATAVATIAVFIIFGTLVYKTPLLHYREENKLKSNKKPEYYLERGLDKIPLVEIIENQGWEEVNSTEDKISLETYPSFIHRFIGRKSIVEIEILQKEDNKETAVVRKDGKEIEKIKSIIEPKDDGSIIQETGVSLKRYSPVLLELILLMYPQIEDELKEAAEEKLEFIDENVEFGLSKFSLESE
jgi:hypothetical protein